MLRTNIRQNQGNVPQRNELISVLSLERTKMKLSLNITTMMNRIKIESKNSMDKETYVQFSNTVDAIVRMIEEISE